MLGQVNQERDWDLPLQTAVTGSGSASLKYYAVISFQDLHERAFRSHIGVLASTRVLVSTGASLRAIVRQCQCAPWRDSQSNLCVSGRPLRNTLSPSLHENYEASFKL
jgi:hypothetical protein